MRHLHKLPLLLLLIAAGLFLPLVRGRPAVAQEAVARFYLFYGDTCPHCHEVMEGYLPQVYDKYGPRVEYKYFEIYNNVDNYITLLGLERKLGVPEERQGSVPALVIGDVVLVGGLQIPEQLEGHIDRYLAQGGVEFPSLENLPEVVVPTPQPAVEILVFYDPGHGDFSALGELISTLAQSYGSQLVASGADLTQGDNAARLAELNRAFGVPDPAPGTPEILIGRTLLVGLAKIRTQLPPLVEQYAAQGGLPLPAWDDLVSGTPSASPAPPPQATEPVLEPIHLAYFEQAGCQECARTTYDLNVVQAQFPQLQVESFSIEDADNKLLNEWLSQQYGVPEEKRLSSPMVFVGDDVLIGTEATLEKLLAAVGKYAQSGAEARWDDFDPAQAEQGLIARFRSLGVLTVAGAGLIDGLNPCAFATLVFFISYLAFTGRRGRDILLVGLAFALGVFITYLLVGVGLLKAVQSLSFFTALGRWLYLLTALLCVVLAVLTFRDYLRARRGQASEMALKLPMALRRRIHQVIRENAQVRAFVVMAFVTGFVVSLIELACTGQVYLPTIVYVMSKRELAAQAFLYLLLYCFMFIVPLAVVFLLSYFGTTSDQLARFVDRYTAPIKFLTGIVFVGLALWMTWTLAPLFGVGSLLRAVLMVVAVAVIVVAALALNRFEKKNVKRPASRRRRSRA